MLYIYSDKDTIPKDKKYIDCNDIFFNTKTTLSDGELVPYILQKIDGAKKYSDLTFIPRNEKLGSLYKEFLSTGCKTLLNIISYNNYCFDLVECGNNVLHLLPYISMNVKQASVFWRDYCFPFDSIDCNFMYDGVEFSSTKVYNDYVRGYFDEIELPDFI